MLINVKNLEIDHPDMDKLNFRKGVTELPEGKAAARQCQILKSK
jgi:hypothetical protein